MKQLRKLSGLKTVKITGMPVEFGKNGNEERLKELHKLEEDLKASPAKLPKEDSLFFGKKDPDSPAVRKAQKHGIEIARKLQKRKDLLADQDAIRIRLEAVGTERRALEKAMEQAKEALKQADAELSAMVPKPLSGASEIYEVEEEL